MKNLALFILLVSVSLTTCAQTTKRTTRKPQTPISTVNPANEKEDFDRAVALADITERINALQKFVADYPKSKDKSRALELLTSARAALADEKLRAGEREAGIELFKLAVRETPKPVTDKLFTEVILQIPTSLFFRGESAAAIEIARLAEEKADANAKQTLALATFYLGTENAGEAKRLANRAAQLEPNLPAAFQTLGIANRLDFQFEESVNAYQKALELDANSAVSKRALAEMKRAVGKSPEAVALYREVLAKDGTDAAAQTGLVLALFDAENKTEAETEMQKSLEANPNNLFLLVGAAYWYAAHNEGAKAVELAEKAVAVEPRYTWARIALARGLMLQKRPFDAEKALLAAKQYGDFPTLDYELAAARLQAGFYREAAEGLQKKFAVKDNSVETYLGGRVPAKAKSFVELLAAERRASIFQPLAADNVETADRLKSLLDFSSKLETATDEEIAAATNEFTKGDDKMKLYRQLFAANQLAQKRKALPKALELTKSAVGAIDAGLDIPNAAAAVLADALYQSRKLAMARGELVIVPELPRQTLSNIVRGRIEDTAGFVLLQDNKSAEAVTRMKRAVSILPEKSSFWRNSLWRLGSAQDAAGNYKDALDAYIQSYTEGEADVIKYGVIEAVYQKVNGSTDGLEAKIGVKPASLTSDFTAQNKSTDTPKSKSEFAPDAKAETKPEPTPAPTIIETAPTVVETKPTPEITNAETPVKTEPAATPETKTEVETQKPTVEATPDEQKVLKTPDEAKIEKTPEEPKVEPKPAIENPASENKPKPLFEPIVINIPNSEPAKKPAETKTETEKPAETAAPKIEDKPVEPITEKRVEPITEPKPDDIESRPRVVVTENLPAQSPLPCKIIAGQETVSIINNGGNMSVLLRLEGEVEKKEITAASSSPADVEVILEPEFGQQTSRSFFSVKSISTKTGTFTLAFESACGKKEILVKVR